jgi:uncharacterized protein YuzE
MDVVGFLDPGKIRMSADGPRCRARRIQEDGIECWFDTHLAEMKIRKRTRSEPPPYHAFVFELSKRTLKRFPLLVAYDRKGRLVGVTIFKPVPAAPRKKPAQTKLQPR